MEIITVYDNNQVDNSLRSDWGFSCFIDHPKCKIIFDTGANEKILEANLKKLSINPLDIDIVIVSHKHYDHKGGASWLLQTNEKIVIYLPKTFGRSLEKKLSTCRNVIYSIEKNYTINDTFTLIVSKNLFVTELALAINTSNGIILISGCSHTGINKIIKKTVNLFNDNIYGIIGGLHLFRSSQGKIRKLSDSLKEDNIGFIAPCHCTGDKAIAVLKESKLNVITNGVGARYNFDI
jgi:7,8-dihydropterin-6-yl-methyl-4-(beta-D-ribofuranosyl)aminobenzene 5'-phosphate synthase